MLFLGQAQMLLSAIHNSLKLALPYQTKRRESDHLTKVSEFSSQYFPRCLVPSVAYEIKSVYLNVP